MIKIKSIAELKKYTNGTTEEFAIVLKGGLLSRKVISYDGKFHIWNLIDDSKQTLTEKQLLEGKVSNINEAIEKGSFFIEKERKKLTEVT